MFRSLDSCMAVARAMLAARGGSPRRTETAVIRAAFAAWSVASSARCEPTAAVHPSVISCSERCSKAAAV